MKIIIPMAGNGTRFSLKINSNPEYAKPKPLIRVKNKPMISWAVESFPSVPLHDFIFVVLKQHIDSHEIDQKLYTLFGKHITVVSISAVTKGAAETALQASHVFKKDDEVIIADSDQYLETLPLLTAINKKPKHVRAIVPVTKAPKGEEGKHSYSLSFDNVHVVAVAEKDPELAKKGAYANIGAYYFASAFEYFEHVRSIIKRNKLSGPAGREEFYVSGVYQDYLDAKKVVQMVTINKGWRLGAPDDVEFFEKHYPKSKI